MACVTQHLFNSNNSATSATLAEVCALLSAILVIIIYDGLFAIFSAITTSDVLSCIQKH